MDDVSAGGRQFLGTEETGVPAGDTFAAGIGGTVGNTRNGHDMPPKGIRHSRKSVDTEEGTRIHLEKVSEKDIRRQCAELYAALGIDVPSSDQAHPETGSFPYLNVAGGGIPIHRPASQGRKCRDLPGRRDRDQQLREL